MSAIVLISQKGLQDVPCSVLQWYRYMGAKGNYLTILVSVLKGVVTWPIWIDKVLLSTKDLTQQDMRHN